MATLVNVQNNGAVNKNQTFRQAGQSQSYIDQNFAGVGATLDDHIDWAAWQKSLNKLSSEAVIAARGTYYFGNKGVAILEGQKHLTIEGNNCLICTTGSGTFPIISRAGAIRDSNNDYKPLNNSKANELLQGGFKFRDIRFKGSSNQTALSIYSTYGSEFTNIWTEGCGTAIKTRFALNSYFRNCFATNVNNGWTVTYGDWEGADTANSQSNLATFHGCRYYHGGTGGSAFGIYSASGCIVEKCIVEGLKVDKAIDFNAFNSTVVHDLSVKDLHFECVQGATTAAVYFRAAGGQMKLENAFGQYASILVDAATTSGLGDITIERVSYWVPVSGKYFKNDSCSWIFNYNEPFRSNSNIGSMFNGTAVSLCGGVGCGYNKYSVVDIPR